jgi:hypothetical protein
MKYISLFILSAMLLTTACEKTIQAGDGLTQAERDYLAQRAAEKCLEDTAKGIEDFQEISADNIMDLERDKAWKYEYKKEANVLETYSIAVWNVVPPNIYIRLNIVEGGTTYNKFIKISTTANSDMIKTLQTKKCNKSMTLTMSTSTATATIEDARIDGSEEDTFLDVTTAYNFKSTLPAYFGFLDRLITKKTVDDDDAVKKTEKYSYVISDNTSAPDQNDVYTTYSNRQYCMVEFTGTNLYAFPYTMKCTAVGDETGVDINGDAVKDFVPADLVI